MSELRFVVFDLDGTLIESQHLIVAAMRAAFVAAGYQSPTEAAILSIVGLSLPVAVAALAPEIPQAHRAAITDGYRLQFAAARAVHGGEAKVPLYPGARAALDALAQQPFTRGRDRKGAAGARPCFPGARSRAILRHVADGGRASVQAAPVHAGAALAETGGAAGRAVMVGDSEFDIVVGRAAGSQPSA